MKDGEIRVFAAVAAPIAGTFKLSIADEVWVELPFDATEVEKDEAVNGVLEFQAMRKRIEHLL